MYPFCDHKFDAVQRQHCQDLLGEAERERLALEVLQAQSSQNKIWGPSQLLLARLSGFLHRG